MSFAGSSFDAALASTSSVAGSAAAGCIGIRNRQCCSSSYAVMSTSEHVHTVCPYLAAVRFHLSTFDKWPRRALGMECSIHSMTEAVPFNQSLEMSSVTGSSSKWAAESDNRTSSRSLAEYNADGVIHDNNGSKYGGM